MWSCNVWLAIKFHFTSPMTKLEPYCQLRVAYRVIIGTEEVAIKETGKSPRDALTPGITEVELSKGTGSSTRRTKSSWETTAIRYAKLIELSFEPIFVWHPDEGILEWNRGAEMLYGYSKAEALGQCSHLLLNTVAPHSPNALIEILRRDGTWTGELHHETKDGRRITVESRHQGFDNDGELLILETNRDVSQRHQADNYTAQMAAVALASHDALFGVTLDGYFQTWNPAAARLFGYSTAEILGKHISILAEPVFHGDQRELMRRATHNETVGPYEARRLRKDGTTIDVSVSIAPVKARDGTLRSLSIAVHDISDRKEWEVRQKLMTRELAHRIKNSFAVLQGILRSTLRNSRNSKEFADAFSGRLQSLAAAQDVLTASNWKGAELGELAKHQLSAYVEKEDNRIEFVGPPINLPPEQATPFGLVFNELATNALKYGALSVPEGSVLVVWRTEREIDSTIRLFLTWRERGGPVVKSPQGARGFGSLLIERGLAGAKVTVDYEPEGLTCKIEMSMKPPKRLRSRRNAQQRDAK